MNKLLFFAILCILLLVDMTNFTFVVPVIPDFLLSKGVSLSLIGFILSFYQISFFLTSLYLGKNLVYFSKKKLMTIGQLTLILANLALSFLNYNLTTVSIIILSSLLRFIQGISLALVCSTIYSYVPMLFPTDLDRKYAMIEISLGGGMALGPVIGGFLYEYVYYTWSFGIMSILYTLVLVFLFPYILNFNLNDKTQEEQKKDETEMEMKTEPIKIRNIVKNRNFILTFLVFIFSYITYNLIQPGFSQHVHDYNGSEDTVGIIFGVGDLTYAFTGFLLLHFLSKIKIKRKYFFLFGGTMSMISLLILGPENYTYLPKNLTVVAIGMGLIGFAQMFYTATLIPEFLDLLKEMDPNAKGSDEMACGLFNASVATTEFFGNILGGILSDNFGFSRGMALYSLVLCAVLLAFAILRKYDGNVEETIEVDETNLGGIGLLTEFQGDKINTNESTKA